MDKSICETAKERFQKAKDANSTLRQEALDDTRFVLGDSTNNWQWPDDIYGTRSQVYRKPCLTVNITAQHCNQIINAIRQNRPTGKVLPVDGFADVETADILAGLIRSIQSYSNADTAHDIAAMHSIYGGEGYWYIDTEYESDDSFNLALCIRAIQNPNLVYVDPDAIEPDRADAKWGFIFEDIPKEQAQREHPNVTPANWGDDPEGWVKKDVVRRARYWWCEEEPDTLLMLSDGATVLKSKCDTVTPVSATIQGVVIPLAFKDGASITRAVTRKQWYQALLVGGETEPVDKKPWPGSLLPIVGVYGVEVNVDGKIVRKGLVRDLKDSARLVNYSFSAAAETVALQTKTPWAGPLEAFEGLEDIWEQANSDTRAYLPFNHLDSNGQPLPAPQRVAPASMATAQVQMLSLSVEQMRAASGQQNANFGIKSEAQSGIGIQRLKAQGEIATFHFPDNLARSLRYEMRVLIDLIPKTYDTQRIVRILGIDGTENMAEVNPDMQMAYAKGDDKVAAIFNPLMGRYDVSVDTGPSYQTQRQEAAAAMTELAQGNPILMNVAPDLVIGSYDFPNADELAKRLRKTVAPELLDDPGDNKEEPEQLVAKLQQMQQQMQQMQEAGAALQMENEQLKTDKQLELLKLDIEQYNADTNRLKATATLTPEQIAQIEAIKQKGETERVRIKAQIDADAKTQIAAMTAQAAEKPAAMVQFDAKDQLGEIGETIKGMASESGMVMAQAIGQLTQTAQAVADAANTMTVVAAEMARPKTKVIQRDKNGRAIGLVEVSEV